MNSLTSSRRELVDEILGRHLGAGGGELISATTVARCASYPFALWCDLFAPEDERDADSEFLVMRREAGHAHELKMIEGEVVPVPSQTLEEGFRHTVELMAAGEAKIFQGPLISRPSGMAGIPDQLVKMARSRSIFGNYRYRVVEVKSQYNLTAAHRVNRQMRSRAPKKSHPRRVGSSYLLNGLVKCHKCNCALSGQDSRAASSPTTSASP